MRNLTYLTLIILVLSSCSIQEKKDTAKKYGSIVSDPMLVKPVGYEYPKDSVLNYFRGMWNIS